MKITVKNVSSLTMAELQLIGKNLFTEYNYLDTENLKNMLETNFKDQTKYFIKELIKRLYQDQVISKDLNGKITKI